MIKRIVLKVGSNVLSKAEGGLDESRLSALASSISNALAAGVEVIVVSSGAVSAGRGILGLKKKPTTLPELQAVAAIGQGALVAAWGDAFIPHHRIVAQMLLTRDDMDDRRRYLNARLALISLLAKGVVPIINENDSVTIDELKFGDNDMLSAMVAAKMDADLLVILSNVPGLMTAHPKHDPSAKLIETVNAITPEILSLVHTEGSEFGTGGMATKLAAARHATSFGVATIIMDGARPEPLESILAGNAVGTLFKAPVSRRAGGSRRNWISSRRPRGLLTIDPGARRALTARKSLLAVGIRSFSGAFEKGDVVSIIDTDGHEVARGITNFPSDMLARIIGKHDYEISEILQTVTYQEVIHSNNLVLLA